MKHLLLPLALLIALQPVVADIGKPNGATLAAAALVFVWGLCMVASPSKR